MAKMVKIEILSACYQNRRLCKVGEIVEVPESTARECIWLKRGKLHVEKPSEPPAAFMPDPPPTEGPVEAGTEVGDQNAKKKGRG